MAFDLVGQIMHVDDRAFDARRRETIQHMIDQRPAATGTSGFGMRAVSGRIRSPKPAASTIAVRGALALRFRPYDLGRG